MDCQLQRSYHVLSKTGLMLNSIALRKELLNYKETNNKITRSKSHLIDTLVEKLPVVNKVCESFLREMISEISDKDQKELRETFAAIKRERSQSSDGSVCLIFLLYLLHFYEFLLKDAGGYIKKVREFMKSHVIEQEPSFTEKEDLGKDSLCYSLLHVKLLMEREYNRDEVEEEVRKVMSILMSAVEYLCSFL